MRGTSLSIFLNIVEGSGKFSKKNKAKFCHIARICHRMCCYSSFCTNYGDP
ncbi:four helix bundle protein [Candidatus Uabimicrobium sp. HlEnr_7]